jgi:hypothetical protein
MTIAVAAFGVLFGGIGALGAVRPRLLAKFLRSMSPGGAFTIAVALRLVLGIVLISAASASAYPTALRVFGYLALIGVVILLLMGPARLRDLTESWLGLPPAFTRLIGVATFLLGVFLVDAAFPGFSQ